MKDSILYIGRNGFCISSYEYIFRWLIRGDTLCEVKIPKDTKIYKAVKDKEEENIKREWGK